MVSQEVLRTKEVVGSQKLCMPGLCEKSIEDEDDSVGWRGEDWQMLNISVIWEMYWKARLGWRGQ
jgi:hypothetical protein